MSYRVVEADGSSYEKEYGLTGLAAKIAACSELDEKKIRELREIGNVTVSGADCVQKACARLMQAREHHEKVFIGGDYDADGICATAIMKKTLDVLGIANGYYIPDRLKEGYGLSVHTVQLAVQKGYTLIITVDNGVKAFDAVEAAKDLGIDVIVTDHHVLEGEVKADILVHPDLMEEDYSTLSGAGVALEISRALIGDDPDLVAIAAVAAIGDVMPLWKETRRIVNAGLHWLSSGHPAPLVQLVQQREIDETAVAFQIVPKLNAVSRMRDDSNVNTLVRYLLLTDTRQIMDYALQLERVNDARKNLSRRMTRKAESILTDDDFILLYDPSFETGISGLVAGRIANACHRPTLVMAENGEMLVGSARSVPGFNVYDFFSGMNGLQEFGGHAMAAGLSIRREDYPVFCRQVQEKMHEAGFVYQEPEIPAILCDADDMNLEEIMGLSVFSPYPKDIVQPVFAIRDPVQLDVMKRTKVCRYHFANRTGGYDGVLFSFSGIQPLEEPHLVIGKPSLNKFRDRINCQMVIEELR